MTEMDKRQAVVATLQGWLGITKGSPEHHTIIDIYNAYPDLPLRNGRPYRMSYTDNWCACTVSAAAIVNGLTGIMPVECSCTNMIELYKGLGRWVEDDAYVPQIGDVVFYAWGDNGQGDCKLSPNHVGIVETVDPVSGVMTVIEGNKGTGTSEVGRRPLRVNGRYIRGYGIPDYASVVDKPWYADAQAWVKNMHIADGSRPEDLCQRAEVWTMLMRLSEALTGGK